jgi:hypothetical protein
MDWMFIFHYDISKKNIWSQFVTQDFKAKQGKKVNSDLCLISHIFTNFFLSLPPDPSHFPKIR